MSASVTKSVGSSKSPTKRFNNGHVCFVASQQKAFQELLKKEFEKRELFETHKMELVMPRNPLIGEPTPREGEGRPLMDANWSEPVRSKYPKSKPVTTKIGVNDKRYEFLGNSPTRQGRSGQLASAGLASLSTPAATLECSDLSDNEIILPAVEQEVVNQSQEDEIPISKSARSVSTSNSTLRTSAGSTPARKTAGGSRHQSNEWEQEGNNFYFKIME